jgi:hypothetical protein
MAKDLSLTVTVSGGVAYTSNPDILIVDYDNLQDDADNGIFDPSNDVLAYLSKYDSNGLKRLIETNSENQN